MEALIRLNNTCLIFGIFLLRCAKRTIFFYKRAKRVPSIANDLLKYSAGELAAKIRRREVSCYEVVSTYIQRIREVNPIINAVAEDRFEHALDEARNIDELIAQTTDTTKFEKTKPLLGVPVTIKENLSLKGLSQTLASKIHNGNKAKFDGEAVQRLKSAGAIPLLVSITPEYCIAGETFSKMFGITANPYNSLRTCGGSSGGEGALLGAGASLIGLGSDLAGSIRFPSAFNGIFGHKPTHGYVPIKGHKPDPDDPEFVKNLVVGPMTRYADDLLLMMKVLTDNDPQLKLDDKIDMSRLRIYFMEDCTRNFGTVRVQREIKDAIKMVAHLLSEQHKAVIIDKKFETIGYSLEMCLATSAKTQYSLPLRTKQGNHSVIKQACLYPFGLSKFSLYIIIHDIIDKMTKFTPESKIKKYEEMVEKLREEISMELGDHGIFLFPAYPTTAFRHKEFLLGYMSVFYAFLINILGFPSTTVPVGFDNNGLPIGIQVIANFNQDRLCIGVAQEIERLLGGWKSP